MLRPDSVVIALVRIPVLVDALEDARVRAAIVAVDHVRVVVVDAKVHVGVHALVHAVAVAKGIINPLSLL